MGRQILYAILLCVFIHLSCMDGRYGVIKRSQTSEYIRYEIIDPDGEFIMATYRFQAGAVPNFNCICSHGTGVKVLPQPKFYFEGLKARYEQQEARKQQ